MEEKDLRFNQITWIDKYRPVELSDLVLPKPIFDKFSDIIETHDMPNIILVGPSGIGKSSVIHVTARKLFGKYYNEAVLELNSFDDRGIKFMQNDIITYCKTKIAYKRNDEEYYPKYKLIIFDEADNIISRVQDQISSILEKYPETIRFAFTCNSSSEINETIQSKCIIKTYSYFSNELGMSRLKVICENEKINFTDKALLKIMELSCGDIRKAINKTQIIYNKHGKITEKNCVDLCNLPHEAIIKQLFDNIIKKNYRGSIELIKELKNNSYSGSDIVEAMFKILKSPLCKDIPENKKMILLHNISIGTSNISNIMDSNIQLMGCIIKMIQNI